MKRYMPRRRCPNERDKSICRTLTPIEESLEEMDHDEKKNRGDNGLVDPSTLTRLVLLMVLCTLAWVSLPTRNDVVPALETRTKYALTSARNMLSKTNTQLRRNALESIGVDTSTTTSSSTSSHQGKDSSKTRPKHDAAVTQDILDSLPCQEDNNVANTNKYSALDLFCNEAKQQQQQHQQDEQDTDDNNSLPNKVLLDIWKAAKEKMPMDIIRTTLSLAVRTNVDNFAGIHSVELWAPQGDVGIATVLKELGKGNGIAEYGLADLPVKLLGPTKLFVDAGSNLGLVSLEILLRYPGTRVLTLEAAAPTWLLQQLNLKLNLPVEQHAQFTSVQAGLGIKNGDSFPMMWRPSSTTSTRSWTPRQEYKPKEDNELQVPVRTLRSVLVEAGLAHNQQIDLFKIDCEGCEYNVIPDMTDDEFEAVQMIVGELHWGYIPTPKKPSSARAATTHQRLCRHYNIASQAKECCAFPGLEVKYGDQPRGTVSHLASNNRLCAGFAGWADKVKLFDIRDDSGWFDTTSSMA